MDGLCIMKEVIKRQIKECVYLFMIPVMPDWKSILNKIVCACFSAHFVPPVLLALRMIPFPDLAVNPALQHKLTTV